MAAVGEEQHLDDVRAGVPGLDRGRALGPGDLDACSAGRDAAQGHGGRRGQRLRDIDRGRREVGAELVVAAVGGRACVDQALRVAAQLADGAAESDAAPGREGHEALVDLTVAVLVDAVAAKAFLARGHARLGLGGVRRRGVRVAGVRREHVGERDVCCDCVHF